MNHRASSPAHVDLDAVSGSSSLGGGSQPDHNHNSQHPGAAGNHQFGSMGDATLVRRRQRPHALDLYSIPVFLLELVLLGALGVFAYMLHFEWRPAPFLSGIYCDDQELNHEFRASPFASEQFLSRDKETMVLALLLAVPITVVSLTLHLDRSITMLLRQSVN